MFSHFRDTIFPHLCLLLWAKSQAMLHDRHAHYKMLVNRWCEEKGQANTYNASQTKQASAYYQWWSFEAASSHRDCIEADYLLPRSRHVPASACIEFEFACLVSSRCRFSLRKYSRPIVRRSSGANSIIQKRVKRLVLKWDILALHKWLLFICTFIYI